MTAASMTLEQLQSNAADAPLAYRRSVVEAARNGSVSATPAAMSTLLMMAGRTMPQFLADVARVRQRIAAVQSLRVAESREPEMVELEEAELTEAAKLRELIQRHEQELRQQQKLTDAAASRRFSLRSVLDETKAKARQTLISTSDPAIESERQAMNAAIDRPQGRYSVNDDPEIERKVNFALRAASERFKNSEDRPRSFDEVKEEIRSRVVSEHFQEREQQRQRLIDSIPEIESKKLNPECFGLTP